MTKLSTTTNVLGWIFFALAAIAVALRFTRLQWRRDVLRPDDWLVGIFLLLNLCGVIFNTIANHYGLGEHIEVLEATNPSLIPKAGLWAIVADSFCLFADVVPKLAVAVLVNRVLSPRPAMKAFHLALVLLLNVFTVVTFLVSILQCHPVQHQWNPKGVPGACLNPSIFEKIGIAEGALGSFVDLYFSIYPPIIIAGLQMSWKRKVVPAVTMSLGLFTLFTTLYKTAGVLPRLRGAQADVTYILSEVVLWGLFEASVTIIAGSIPTWGWILRTQSFESLVAWTSMLGSRFSGSRAPLNATREHEHDANSLSEFDSAPSSRKDTMSIKGSNRNLDSIAELERSAIR